MCTRMIFTDTDTRNLFFFLLVNFSFAIVELVYGIWTNSLGSVIYFLVLHDVVG